MKDEVAFFAKWVALYVWDQILDTYRAMPGPWWVKLLIVAAALAIPGPQDELALIAVVKVCRWYRSRRMQWESQ